MATETLFRFFRRRRSRQLVTTKPEVWSSAATADLGLGREGMVTVWDAAGRYVGCMGIERWKELLG